MDLQKAVENNPHLGAYLQDFAAKGKAPEFHERLSRDMKSLKKVNVLYPVGDPIFIHIWDDEETGQRRYVNIEPALTDEDRRKYVQIKDKILRLAPFEPTPRTQEDLRQTLRRLIDRSTRVGGGATPGGAAAALSPARLLSQFDGRVVLTQQERNKLAYFLERDIVDSGVLEPIIRDPYIEDVSSIGTYNIFVVHKIFDTVETNVKFRDEKELDDYLRNMGERIGRPVSESRPIVDAVMPDGSRINIIYSDDVSQRGSSFTIRKFSDTPTSITQICKWGTMSTSVAAYLWICLQNGMSVFVCGETASGKTTSLNGILSFIKPKEKVFTAEDTPEVRPPQPLWQQLVTRSAGPAEGRVEMFDLLKAALRSRPNYIIVGEIRGAEGAVAFQAMQTGHPCIATFHASSVQKMIQRFTSDPINVPVTFMDNLNVCMIQMAVYNKGRMLRRVLAIEEIEGYNEQAGGVLTRRVFNWDPVKDVHQFRGRNNSYILEQKIAEKAGYADKRKIYEELDLRTHILDRMIQLGIYDYYEVNRIIARFNEEGVQSLPFKL
ncbi:MAG TPA: type II/IV secretion system ATPase subunit [Candidatus Thermoplasmatota archaeon]|nr:type II/IV secretion system ATPase subunit [Candidatus Thermoplasmatota archaeon]